MLKLNVKVIRFKLFLAEAEIDFEAMPKRMNITRNRWNWLINEKVEEDRLEKMDPVEVLDLARIMGERPEDLGERFGLGNPRWVKSLREAINLSKNQQDLSLQATAV